jgi:hypothetical protein
MLQQFRLSTKAVNVGGCFDVDGSNLSLSYYADLRVTPAQLPFDGLPQVLQQMKAVRYLPSLRRTPARTLCVEAATVPANDLDFRVLLKPLRGRLSRAFP